MRQRNPKDEIKGLPAACLFVGSLLPDMTEIQLTEYFGTFGKVLKVTILEDKMLQPYAFVQYELVEEMERVLIVDSHRLDDRRLRVDRAKINHTLFVAKLNSTISNLDLRGIASVYGDIENVTIIKNHATNKSRGCGFIKFKYREDAAEAFFVSHTHILSELTP